MSSLQSIARLAQHAGFRLVRDEESHCWLVQRGQKTIHREHSLAEVEHFLSAWLQYVR